MNAHKIIHFTTNHVGETVISNNQLVANDDMMLACDLYRKAKSEEQYWANQKQSQRTILMNTCFSRCEFLVNDFGIILASAKLHERSQFDTESFKKNHPDLYEKYTKKILIQSIDVK
jgi:hypothetical protein